MVFAVQRTCPVLVSNVCFLGIGLERMTFFKGIGRGYYIIIIIIKEHFLKTIRNGLDKCIAKIFFMAANAFDFLWWYSHPLRSTVGSQKFLPGTFF